MSRARYLVGQTCGWWIGSLLLIGTGLVTASAADPPQKEKQQADGPAAEVASATLSAKTNAANSDSSATDTKPPPKPAEADAQGAHDAQILQVLEFARTGYEQMTKTIRDYTCVIYRREPRENPRDRAQYIFAKIRHEQREGDKIVVPFSVYLRFLKPDRVKGREVLYVRGRNNGDLIARRGGRRSPNMTFQLDPNSPLAMEGNRYPVTEVGIKNLTKQLIGVLEKELTSEDCEVKSFRDAKLNNRPCTHFQVRHTVRRPDQRYYMARVLVDDELKIPVYFASYDWPKDDNGKAQLLEEYAYLNIKINVGLTDKDFDVTNPEYHFKQLGPPPDDISPEIDDTTAPADDAATTPAELPVTAAGKPDAGKPDKPIDKD